MRSKYRQDLKRFKTDPNGRWKGRIKENSWGMLSDPWVYRALVFGEFHFSQAGYTVP